MNLYIYPSAAITTNGYGLAVIEDLKKQDRLKDDIVIWYVKNSAQSPYYKNTDIVIKRLKPYGLKRIWNVLRNRVSGELYYEDIKFLRNKNIGNVFCGDVVFYRAIRKLFPDKQITVRFHNCFSRINTRTQILDVKSNLKFRITLKSMFQLEKEIFNDKKVYKLFISNEDRDYYSMITGRTYDSDTWSFTPNEKLMYKNRKAIHFSKKIVWFGGLEKHKQDSVRWFINKVFMDLKKDIPDLEFHLWGKGTTEFNDKKNKIYGHGFYNGEEMPLKGEALYINPDITGGGIKMKLLTYFENGIPFISTPFGYEGYSKELIDNKFCYVVEENEWIKKIKTILI
ncbi:MAG TPA: glycosyltransferase family 4 protein [Gallicola sp.]|nr:glycosyltransferase family 4 protein [Gallicola sp.]